MRASRMLQAPSVRANKSMVRVRFDATAAAGRGGSIRAPLASAFPQRAPLQIQLAAARGMDAGARTSGTTSTSSSSSSSDNDIIWVEATRRGLLIGAAAAAAAAFGAASVSTPMAAAEGLASAVAADSPDDELAAQLPGEPPAERDLPRAYTQNVRQLVKALREAIDAELGGAKEFEVRRKADPAKDLARGFLRRWQDDPAVAGDPARAEVQAALSELGRFYQRNGPRSRLSGDVAAAVLARLDAAEAALPPEKKGLLGI